MATAQQIAALRLLIAEPGPAAPYDDVTLGALIDAAPNMYSVAYEIWTSKAAGAAALVDVSEGGSTRKMGDVYEQYLQMAANMRGRSEDLTGTVGVRVSKLTRP